MKLYLISDNIDTQMGMRLAGVEGVVVHERDEVLAALNKAIEDPEIAIVLMTTKIVKCFTEPGFLYCRTSQVHAPLLFLIVKTAWHHFQIG